MTNNDEAITPNKATAPKSSRTKLTVGSPAPDFVAEGTKGTKYHLEDERGKIVVLVFYPGDGTPVCTRQLTNYSDKPAIAQKSGVVTWAISPQDVDSHEAFAAAHDLQMPLLHDAGKEIAAKYHVLGPLGFYRRSVFIIDPTGIIRFARRGMAGLGYPDASVLQDAVDKVEADLGQ